MQKRKNKKILILGCVHGDEILGKRIKDALSKCKDVATSVRLHLANMRAYKARTRFIDADLNRVFPGNKNGNHEERLAYALLPRLRSADIVLDVHTTRSNVPPLIIVTAYHKALRETLACIPIDTVVIVPSRTFGKGALIHESRIGVSLEYAREYAQKHFSRIYSDMLQILINCNACTGKKKTYARKKVFRVIDTIPARGVVQEVLVHELSYVRKGQVLGSCGATQIRAHRNGYVLFLGKGRYQDIFCLLLERV